jgi:glycosyltransferase involved in cell wall biosynthesis
MSRLRCLGVLLGYNDGDLLEESITYLLEQNHDVIAWDHDSTDETPSVVERFRPDLRETPRAREFDFYELYPGMSRHLIENYVRDYDWISWPDQDEILKGPAREPSSPRDRAGSRADPERSRLETRYFHHLRGEGGNLDR